jgi:hypothetical protein
MERKSKITFYLMSQHRTGSVVFNGFLHIKKGFFEVFAFAYNNEIMSPRVFGQKLVSHLPFGQQLVAQFRTLEKIPLADIFNFVLLNLFRRPPGHTQLNHVCLFQSTPPHGERLSIYKTL